jgi:tetratricopeptide (TPR) repeat protein
VRCVSGSQRDDSQQAARLIEEAIECSKSSAKGALFHSKAIILRDLSRESSIDAALRERFREQALELLRAHGGFKYPYTAVTCCEILLDQMAGRLISARASSDAHGRLSDESALKKIEELERGLEESLQRFPEDSALAAVRARFYGLLRDHPRALQILSESFRRNPAKELTAIRLARQLDGGGDSQGAIRVLRSAIDANAASKGLNFELAMLLRRNDERANSEEILRLLRRSFTDGDTHFDAQFWYARQNYLYGDRGRARQIYQGFSSLLRIVPLAA